MIIGHQKQRRYLKSLAQSNRVPHALLFSGPKHLGKRTVALEFVKLLNSHVPRALQDIDKKQYPDLVIIEPARNEIQISQIRELVWKLSLRPYAATFKAAIIDSAHTMNQEAQSCLLKTLEEPKGRALLILLSQHPDALLATIRSRTEEVAFFPLAQKELEEHFPKEIVFLAAGRPGRAINFLKHPEELEAAKQWLKELSQVRSLDYAPRFHYVSALANTPEKIPELLELWLQHFRQCLRLNLKHSLEECFGYVRVIKSIEKTLFLLSKTNVSPRLALETLMLEL